MHMFFLLIPRKTSDLRFKKFILDCSPCSEQRWTSSSPSVAQAWQGFNVTDDNETNRLACLFSAWFGVERALAGRQAGRATHRLSRLNKDPLDGCTRIT